MDDLDIWRSADVLLKQYPEDAALIAARRADALLDQGDVDGFHVWKRIAAAIETLTRATPSARDSLH